MAGVVLSATEFPGNFNSDFNNYYLGGEGSGAGTVDVRPIPEPGSVLLFMAGGLCVALALRRESGCSS